MNTIKLKICGLSREEDIYTANELALDYIGFVFAQKSRRYVSPERAAALKALLNREIKAVGVFVNEDPVRTAQLLQNGIIDIAQLHGKEDDAYIETLRDLLAKDKTDEGRIWQAFRIDTPQDIERANLSKADMVLLDHGNGGTGEAFDWSLLGGMRRPYMLAGGLTPENVSEALAETSENGMLYGLDISSGVETDKIKDPDKMRRFAQNARG